MKQLQQCIIAISILVIMLCCSPAYSNPTIVYDIYPSSQSSTPSELTIFKSKLYFAARDETSGKELWMYNALGPPINVADIYPGSLGSYPSDFMVYNSKLYFRADDGTSGHELWVYDGDSPPTMVANINTSGDSNPRELTVFDSKLYFQANDGINGSELWVYDGVNPPTMVTNINPEPCVETDPDYIDYYPCSSSPGSFTIFNSKLYFRANDWTNGSELWVYDGVNPPAMVANINLERYSYDPTYGLESGASTPNFLTVFNSKLYFSANDGINGTELWVYDGGNLPVMVDNINPLMYGCTRIDCGGESRPSYLTVFNSMLYFSANDGINGTELWVYDGGSHPIMVADINTSGDSSPSSLTVVNSKLFFSANDGINGAELWAYDGIFQPLLMANINAEPSYPGYSGSSSPSSLIFFESNLYFSANDGVKGIELWVYKPPRPLATKSKFVAPMLHLMLLKQ